MASYRATYLAHKREQRICSHYLKLLIRDSSKIKKAEDKRLYVRHKSKMNMLSARLKSLEAKNSDSAVQTG